MKKSKTIMIQGTGSGVGKSVIVSGLCRIFLQDGYSVAPFKSQNMALNSFVTSDGGEIGRAQATQALACKIKPTVDINPILIKPTSHTSAQIILHGKPVKNMFVYEYKNYKRLVFNKVKESFKRLSKKYEIIVIEGAGSPAEINLKSHDLVNMKIAKLASSPVILVGDIDKGGVFAWLIGTLQLLDNEEKKMIKGFIINKFRGDKRLLRAGIKFLENYTGIKVLGVIPYFNNIKIPEEDSVSLDLEKEKVYRTININVIHLPHISNFTDFDALELEPDVSLKYVRSCEDLDNSDVIIIPGTKNTIEDLNYLKKSALSKKILSVFKNKNLILIGICGGYQMLGKTIYDKKNVESKRKEIKGLGIIPIITEFHTEKILSQVNAKDLSSGIKIKGYEIHHGRTKIFDKNIRPKFKIVEFKNKKTKRMDGAQTKDKRCWGTYIHGIFDNDKFRKYFLNDLRKRKGLQVLIKNINYDVDKEIDKLARLLRKNININLLYNILKGR